MVVCYSHSLLPLCQLTLTSPLARGDILSCSAIVCLCGDFSFWFVCRWAGAASRGFPEASLRALGVPKPLPYGRIVFLCVEILLVCLLY